MIRPVNYLFSFLLILWVALPASAQQTLQLSQYTFNGLAVNPAYAGYKEDWTARLGYRLQWAGFQGAPRTATLSADGLISDQNRNMGVGLLVLTEKAGPQNLSSVYANYAYRLQLDEEDTRRLCVGAAVGLSQYSLDASAFNPSDIADNALSPGDADRLQPDVRAGVYYSSSSAYIGFSVINLLSGRRFSTSDRIARQERHFYFTVGGLIPGGSSFDFKPSLLIKEDLKGPTNLDISNYIAIKRILWLGASYRSAIRLWNKSNLQNNLGKQDAIAALAQVYWKERFRLGYSYDFTTSKLAGYETGTHELSLSISFLRKRERTLSPRFF